MMSTEIEGLRAKMLTEELLLPDRPIADGRWHECPLLARAARAGGRGYYVTLNATTALFARDGMAPQTWRADEIRTLSWTQRCLIAKAVATFPGSSVKNSVEVSRPAATTVKPSALDAAQQELRAILADGPRPTRELRMLTTGAGASWATVRRAKSRLGVEVVREGFGSAGRWSWTLPKALKAGPETITPMLEE